MGMINLLTEKKFMDHHLYAAEGESHGEGPSTVPGLTELTVVLDLLLLQN